MLLPHFELCFINQGRLEYMNDRQAVLKRNQCVPARHTFVTVTFTAEFLE